MYRCIDNIDSECSIEEFKFDRIIKYLNRTFAIEGFAITIIWSNIVCDQCETVDSYVFAQVKRREVADHSWRWRLAREAAEEDEQERMVVSWETLLTDLVTNPKQLLRASSHCEWAISILI